MDPSISRISLAYGVGSFSLSISHLVFILFYIPLFFSVHQISSHYFYLGQIIYLIWNSINDPLLGSLSDVGTPSATSAGRRVPALRYCGPLCALAFLIIWIPIGCFWGDCAAKPPEFSVFVFFVVTTFLYDGFFTYVTLAHSALLADLSTNHLARTAFNRSQALFSIAAAVAVIVSCWLWQPSALFAFRRWMLLVAVAASLGWIWTAREVELYISEQSAKEKNQNDKLSAAASSTTTTALSASVSASENNISSSSSASGPASNSHQQQMISVSSESNDVHSASSNLNVNNNNNNNNNNSRHPTEATSSSSRVQSSASSPSSSVLASSSSESDAQKRSATRGDWLQALWQFCGEIFELSSFKWFLAMNCAQQFMCSFNNNFWIIFLDVFFGAWLPPWQRAVLVAGAFVLPHLNTVLWTPSIRRVGTYHVIQLLFYIRLAGAGLAALLVGGTLGPSICTGCLLWFRQMFVGQDDLSSANQSNTIIHSGEKGVEIPSWVLMVIGAFLVFNRVMTEAVCRLLNLVVADIVDEDHVHFARTWSQSASVFGLQALLTKPFVSFAPMFGWWVLDHSGLKAASYFDTGAHSAPEAPASIISNSTSSSSLWSRLMAQLKLILSFESSSSTSSSSSSSAVFPAHAIVDPVVATTAAPRPSPTLLWAASTLLIGVPLVLLVLQILIWRHYPLHGTRLKAIKEQREGDDVQKEV